MCIFTVVGPNSVASEGQSDQGGCADTMVVEKSVQEKVFGSEVDIGQLQEYEIPLIENGMKMLHCLFGDESDSDP